ncbi:MAG: hypothetical protein FWF52_08580 [Candidatus Azobacteroides sp.]|nr:hypothetical protein [Candidatus Azobacteroides sp.]
MNKFAKRIGVNQSNLSSMLSGKRPIGEAIINKIYISFDIEKEWLQTGEGEKYKCPKQKVLEGRFNGTNYRLVPLYSLDVICDSNKDMDALNSYLLGYIPFVEAKEEDIAIAITNDDMSPTYPAGSIIRIQKVELWKEILNYGDVHIIELIDNRKLIKEVKKGSDREHFLLVSHNKEYDSYEVAIKYIRSIWLVLAKYQKVVM